jgi:hypothetical protein
VHLLAGGDIEASALWGGEPLQLCWLLRWLLSPHSHRVTGRRAVAAVLAAWMVPLSMLNGILALAYFPARGGYAVLLLVVSFLHSYTPICHLLHFPVPWRTPTAHPHSLVQTSHYAECFLA